MTKFKLYFFSTLLACFSLTFTSCSKDDDDDDNNSKKEQVNDKDDKGDKEEQGQTPIANDKLVGTWVLNEDASTEKVLFNGIDISDAMGGEGVEDGEEVSTLLSKRVTFKEDGTMITSDYNFIQVDFYAEYRIIDPVKALYAPSAIYPPAMPPIPEPI